MRGFRTGLPFLLMIAPFAIVFGVTATEAGLSPAQIIGFSMLVIAGASQFAALQQMVDHAPTLIVVATALAVNLRMAMYSASIAPHFKGAPLWKRALSAYLLVDQTFAMSLQTFEDDPELSVAQRVSYFFGLATPICGFWYVCSILGAFTGALIPESWSIDFIVPIMFIAIVTPMLKTLAHVAAALTSVVMALLLASVPYGLGLIIAALVAMAVGAWVELRIARHRVETTP